jgi:predicted nucleic acid-binding protein
MIRAVSDTNVLVSALISPSGNEALLLLLLLLLAVKQGLVRPLCSSATLRE